MTRTLLMKRLLQISVLLFLLLFGVLAWLGISQSGLDWAYRQALPYLPEQLSSQPPEGRLIGPMILRDVRFEQAGHRLHAREVLVDWHPGALLAARIHISQLRVQQLDIQLASTDAQADADQASQTTTLPDIQLPLRMRLEQVSIEDIRLRQAEQEFHLQQLRLDASSFLSKLDIHALELVGEDFSARIGGKLKLSGRYPHQLDLGWQARLPSGAQLEGKGLLRGNLKDTHVKQRISGPLQLSLEGQLKDLLGQLNWRARVDVKTFDAARLLVDGPILSGRLSLDAEGDLETARVSGQLKADYENSGPIDADFELRRMADRSLQIEHLVLQAEPTGTRVEARGSWSPVEQTPQAGTPPDTGAGTNKDAGPGADSGAGSELQLTLDWQQLRWPLQGEPWFSSAEGRASVSGRPEHYRIELTTDRPWPQAPPSSWYANAEGDLQGLTFHPLRITALDGETLVNGRLSWSPQLSWQADIQASELNPASLWPDWPGRLKARFSSSGGMENGRLVAHGKDIDISGQLRKLPVSLQGQLSWQDDGLDIGSLNIHSGASRITASGRLADRLKLDWRIAAPDLAELYPRARGQLNASGRLSGPRQTPVIDTRFRGQTLALPDYEIGAIDGALELDLARWQDFSLRLAARDLNINDIALAVLDVNGDARQLGLKAEAGGQTLQLALRGTPDNDSWRGHIQTASLRSKPLGDWQLRAPAPLSITRDRLKLDKLCWQQDLQASLCTTLQRDDRLWQTRVNARQLPLGLLGPWLPPELRLLGVADADAQLQLTTPDRLTGQLQLQLPSGSVSYPLLEGERDRWDYRGGSLQLKLDEQGVSAQAQLDMQNGDALAVNAELPGASLLALKPEQQSLRADARLDIHDLGIVEALLPEVQDLKGEIGFRLSAAGTLAKPRLSGRAGLQKGSLRIPRLGLSIEGVTLQAYSDGQETLKLRLDARSGEGDLRIEGQTRLDADAGWPTRVHIGGDNFEVSRIPEARVQVSPDLQLVLQHQRIEVSGELLIPYAKLQPRDITTAARASDDVVIVGGEQPSEEKWTIVTRVRLKLGDRVSFYGYGFEGRLGGSLLLEDEPGQLTRATGEINIPEGRYRAYGQRLDVENGRLLYTGGPLTNPGLDLRAVREVNNVTAGIKVQGTLKQPRLELFSVPAMGETDILSYLVLGRPMENASGEEGAAVAKAALALGLSGGDRLARLLGDRFGLDEMRVESDETGDQASLVVGRYLSPKIYVSYGVGLIEAVNTFTVRYQISEKWQLKAESGEAQGADLLYTIER